MSGMSAAKWAGLALLIAASVTPAVLALFEDGGVGFVIGMLFLPFFGWALTSLALFLFAPIVILCARFLRGRAMTWRDIVVIPFTHAKAVCVIGIVVIFAVLIAMRQFGK